jgi:hypothetical protein
MPTVKWVLEKDIFASYAKVAEYQERDNIAVPIIPLDDLEAWLKDKQARAHASVSAYDDLLAHVQAMRGEK